MKFGCTITAVRTAALLCLGLSAPAQAVEIIVAASGGDYTVIQDALDAAMPGDTVSVREKATPYFEKLVFPTSGSSGAGWITLRAFPGESPVLDGTGVSGDHMIWIVDKSYLRVEGFEIRNNLGVNDGSGVRIEGGGSHLEILSNEIHEIRGQHAMGITVYGTDPTVPISDLTIDGNHIHDCDPYQSEALTLNGNVTGFAVTNNIVRDVNNIGIDFIGGETDIQPDDTKVARNGICSGNTVLRARAAGGGGFAGGIYVDGGRDIVIENNRVSESNLGIEVGAENKGVDVENVIVRSNLLYDNDKVCIVFGGYAKSRGRVRNSQFLHNTCYRNDTAGEGVGELWIQWANDNTVEGNIFYSTGQNILMYSENGNVDNSLDWNLWFADDGASAGEFVWRGTAYTGFANYQAGSGQDANSLFDDPSFVDSATQNFHIAAGSPAINAADPTYTPDPGEVDIDGQNRLQGVRVDLGADERPVGCF